MSKSEYAPFSRSLDRDICQHSPFTVWMQTYFDNKSLLSLSCGAMLLQVMGKPPLLDKYGSWTMS
jgi:hypothetical protein